MGQKKKTKKLAGITRWKVESHDWIYTFNFYMQFTTVKHSSLKIFNYFLSFFFIVYGCFSIPYSSFIMFASISLDLTSFSLSQFCNNLFFSSFFMLLLILSLVDYLATGDCRSYNAKRKRARDIKMKRKKRKKSNMPPGLKKNYFYFKLSLECVKSPFN